MSLRTELELMLTKLSSSAGVEPVEVNGAVVVEGKSVRIRLDDGELKIESNSGKVKVSVDSITDVVLFRKTKHYLIRLSNGMLRIYPCERDFTFFVEIGE